MCPKITGLIQWFNDFILNKLVNKNTQFFERVKNYNSSQSYLEKYTETGGQNKGT